MDPRGRACPMRMLDDQRHGWGGRRDRAACLCPPFPPASSTPGGPSLAGSRRGPGGGSTGRSSHARPPPPGDRSPWSWRPRGHGRPQTVVSGNLPPGRGGPDAGDSSGVGGPPISWRTGSTSMLPCATSGTEYVSGSRRGEGRLPGGPLHGGGCHGDHSPRVSPGGERSPDHRPGPGGRRGAGGGGSGARERELTMGAEDFAFLGRALPGPSSWWSRPSPEPREHHHPPLRIDESVLPLGAAALVAGARKLLRSLAAAAP